MKKIFFPIILILFIAAHWTLCFAQSPKANNHSGYLAQITIQEDLRPPYAANIDVSNTAKNQGSIANVFLQVVAGGIIYLAGPTGILILAIGGLRYVISRGNQPAMDAAKKTITNAIIGLVIIALSLAIVTTILRLISAGTSVK